jgi:hypothetical protein
MVQKQPDKELWLLYYFVMWGDENGFHSHQFKNASRSFESEEKRKASALLKLVPGLTGNFEHQLFLRDYVVESLKTDPVNPYPSRLRQTKSRALQKKAGVRLICTNRCSGSRAPAAVASPSIARAVAASRVPSPIASAPLPL